MSMPLYRVSLFIVLAASFVSTQQLSSKISISAVIKESALEIRWRNDGSSTLLLNMGGLMNDRPLYRFNLSISGVAGKKLRVAVGTQPSVIEGRIDPWVIVLPANAAYVIRLPLSVLLLPDGRNLESIRYKHWRLTVSFTGEEAHDTLPGGKEIEYSLTRNGSTRIPFWRGTIQTDARN